MPECSLKTAEYDRPGRAADPVSGAHRGVPYAASGTPVVSGHSGRAQAPSRCVTHIDDMIDDEKHTSAPNDGAAPEPGTDPLPRIPEPQPHAPDPEPDPELPPAAGPDPAPTPAHTSAPTDQLVAGQHAPSAGPVTAPHPTMGPRQAAWPRPGQEMGGAAMGGRPDFLGPYAREYGGPGRPPPAGPPYGTEPGAPVPGGSGGGPRKPSRWLRWTMAGAGALVLFVGAGAGGAAVALHYGGGSSALPAVQPARGTSNSTAGDSVAKVARNVMPSVVAITVPVSDGEVQGSGVIVKSDGTILTNNHVVADAANGGTIVVQFSDGKKAKATILGRDPSSDLAVIKATGVSGLTAASFADSDQVQVGDSVIAIGSPLGLNGSVTSGIVSAKHRSITLSENEGQNQNQDPNSPFGQFGQGQNSSARQPVSTVVSAIQTDAAINPGNSGGPLLNSAGQVIGINTAIASAGAQSASGGESGNIGVGFAIPSDQAHDIAQQLISNGKAMHAYIGVSVADPMSGARTGAVVAGVTSGSPADHAGLRKGDVITKVGGRQVGDSGALVAFIRGKSGGDKVTVTYTRGGSSHTATVTLGEKAG